MCNASIFRLLFCLSFYHLANFPSRTNAEQRELTRPRMTEAGAVKPCSGKRDGWQRNKSAVWLRYLWETVDYLAIVEVGWILKQIDCEKCD